MIDTEAAVQLSGTCCECLVPFDLIDQVDPDLGEAFTGRGRITILKYTCTGSICVHMYTPFVWEYAAIKLGSFHFLRPIHDLFIDLFTENNF